MNLAPNLFINTFLLTFSLLIPASVSLAAAPKCYYFNESFISSFEGFIFSDGSPGNDLSYFNNSSPIGACSGLTSSTNKSLGPLQFTFQSGTFELTYYDLFSRDSHPIPGGGCSNRETWNKWAFNASGPVYRTGGVYCVAQVEQPPSLSLILPLQQSRELQPVNTGGNSSTLLVARVVEGATPKAGVEVQLTIEVTANSGGHDHASPERPKGKLSITQGSTDANGEVKIIFTSPEVAGIHTIKASCANCSNSPVSQEIRVRVPDLLNIFTIPFRDAQWAYPGIGQTAQHSDHHYLTIAAVTRMLDISRKFKKIWPTAPKLTLNDASLVWGGKFDIDGTWDMNPQRHNEHRVGNNIDVRANTAPGAVPSDIRDVVFRWLRNMSRPSDNIPADFIIDGVNPLHEGVGKVNEHFHLRLGS